MISVAKKPRSRAWSIAILSRPAEPCLLPEWPLHAICKGARGHPRCLRECALSRPNPFIAPCSLARHRDAAPPAVRLVRKQTLLEPASRADC